jgi:hypothetical protein
MTKTSIKLTLAIAFISCLFVGCKKDEIIIEKTPAEKIAGIYTVHDTLVHAPYATATCEGEDFPTTFEIRVRALTSKRVAVYGFHKAEDAIADIEGNKLKFSTNWTPVSKLVGYIDGDMLRISYEWNSVCWTWGKSTAIKQK